MHLFSYIFIIIWLLNNTQVQAQIFFYLTLRIEKKILLENNRCSECLMIKDVVDNRFLGITGSSKNKNLIKGSEKFSTWDDPRFTPEDEKERLLRGSKYLLEGSIKKSSNFLVIQFLIKNLETSNYLLAEQNEFLKEKRFNLAKPNVAHNVDEWLKKDIVDNLVMLQEDVRIITVDVEELDQSNFHDSLKNTIQFHLLKMALESLPKELTDKFSNPIYNKAKKKKYIFIKLKGNQNPNLKHMALYQDKKFKVLANFNPEGELCYASYSFNQDEVHKFAKELAKKLWQQYTELTSTND